MTAVARSVRLVCQQRDEGRCVRCSRYCSSLQLHHRRARGAGSTRRPESGLPANLIHLCAFPDVDLVVGGCHEWVESNREDAREAGWLLRQHQDPSAIPVRRFGLLVLLDNDGGWEAVA